MNRTGFCEIDSRAPKILMMGDFDAAEEAAQEAFAAAVVQWPASGVPEFHEHGSSRRPATTPLTAYGAKAGCRRNRATMVDGIDSKLPKRSPLSRRRCAGGPGRFAVEAAIAALHCEAARAEDKDWPQLVRLRRARTPAALADRAAQSGRGCRDGRRPAAGARADRRAGSDRGTRQVPPAMHATRADLLRQLGMSADAAASYERALALVSNKSERRFPERRLREMQALGA